MVASCITPRISMVAYEEQSWIFVAVPNEKGRYVRTDRCVAYATCPQCKATVGEPCFREHTSGERQYKGATHWMRRSYKQKPSNWRAFKPKRNADDLGEES